MPGGVGQIIIESDNSFETNPRFIHTKCGQATTLCVKKTEGHIFLCAAAQDNSSINEYVYFRELSVVGRTVKRLRSFMEDLKEACFQKTAYSIALLLKIRRETSGEAVRSLLYSRTLVKLK